MRQDFPYEDRNDLPKEEVLQPLAVNLPNPEGERRYVEVFSIPLSSAPGMAPSRWTFGIRWSDGDTYQHRYNTWPTIGAALAAGKKHLTAAVNDAIVAINESNEARTDGEDGSLPDSEGATSGQGDGQANPTGQGSGSEA